MHWAIHRTSDLKIVKLLIEKGADVNAKDKSRGTPLSRAIFWRKSDLEVVKLLTEKGADVNAKVGHLNVPSLYHVIGWTIWAKKLEMVKLLIEKGADINSKGGQLGETPLHIASQAGHLEMVEQFYIRQPREAVWK